MNRVAFAFVVGAITFGVALIIGVTAHYLNIKVGPLPFVLALLVGVFAVMKRNSRAKPRRRPEDHEG